MTYRLLMICVLMFSPLAVVAQDPAVEYCLEDLGTNLEFLYTFDETTGTTTDDQTTNNNDAFIDGQVHASIPDAEVSSTGEDNIIYEDTGTSMGLETDTSIIWGITDDIDEDEDFTITMIVELTDDLASGEGFDCGTDHFCAGLFRKGNGLAANLVFDNVTDLFEVEIFYGTQGHTEVLAANFDPMEPRMFSFTWDASADESEIFVDGVSEGTMSITQTGWDTTSTEAGRWRIGQSDNTSTLGATLFGYIDLFAVWYGSEIAESDLAEVWRQHEAGEEFIRGDANQDGNVDIGDVSSILGTLECEEAGDANDDGMVDIADVVYLAATLFSMGPNPPAPYPNCGGGGALDLTCLEGDGCD